MADEKALNAAASDELLKEIRENFDFDLTEFTDVRKEGDKDMLCVAGRPWEAMDPEGKRQRDEANRPALSLDELGQHFNQVINGVRANPRSPKFSPTGNGANDASARFYADKWREIEYRSHAQIAYITAFENMLHRSYGFCRVNTRFESDESFNQEIWLEDFPNPDMVLPDARAKRPDSSDMKHCFVFEQWRQSEFLRDYPDAQIRDFSSLGALAPKWVKGTDIQLAEYWKIKTKKRELLLFQDPRTQQTTTAFNDEVKKHPVNAPVIKRRNVDVPSVCQYLTNGVEILKTTEWPGKYIPIISCYGKILYVNGKRQVLSMTRLARDPYMLYCYIRTCEAEVVGGVPRNSWIGYKGQFHNPEDWAKAAHEPVAYLEANAKVPDMSGEQPLPLPERQSWDPPLQNLDLAAEAARRAIMSAMAMENLPTSAQRRNEKSGVALKHMDDQQQKGSYHFVDSYNNMLRQAGVIGEDLMDKVYDTARTVGVRKQDETAAMARVNDPQPDPKQYPDPAQLQAAVQAWQQRHAEITDQDYKKGDVSTKGDHVVTVSTGPSFDSEREAASDFADTLIGSKVLEIAGPQKAPKLIALAIRLKNVGALGDEMANIIDPKPDGPPDPNQVAQLANENKQLKGMLQQAAEEIKGKKLELDSKEKIATAEILSKERLDVRLQRMKNASALGVAKINLLGKGIESANEAEVEAIALAHEAEQAEHQRAHEVGLAALEHDNALKASAAAHDQNLEAGEQGQAHALEQGQQAADLAPEPVQPEAVA